ncbi:hypothetical protein JCM17961_40830 [Endothiovibrio diazotrophicus]
MQPDIRLNGSDGPLVGLPDLPLELSISLDSEGLQGDAVEWWLAAETPAGWFSYTAAQGWVPGVVPALAMAPVSVVPVTLPLPSPLPQGEYRFHFGLDEAVDGTPAPAWLDSVSLSVVGEDALPPSFPGIARVTATGTDRFDLSWRPASDNHTAEGELLYEIHADPAAGFTPDAATLVQTVRGELSATVTGLAPATTYQVLVVAVDGDGNRSVERDYETVTTLDVESRRGSGVAVYLPEALGLPEPEQSGSTFTFDLSGGDVAAPDVGELLVGPQGGTGYLRRVVSATKSGGRMMVETAAGSLSEGLEEGSVDHLQRLFDVAEGSAAGSSARLRVSRRGRGAGSVARMEWRDGGLVAEQREGAASVPGLRLTPQDGGRYRLDLGEAPGAGREVEQQVSFELTPSFEPGLSTRLVWGSGGTLRRGEVIARGKLSLDAEATYRLTAGAAYNPEPVELFSRTFRSTYLVGTVPVYQEVILSVKAQASAATSANVTATASAHAATTLSFGVRYNASLRQWQAVSDQTYEKSLTTRLTAKGGATAEVRLIPDITVKFYKALSAGLSVEPYLRGEAAVEAAASSEGVAAELTRFEFALGVECFAHADLNVVVANITILDHRRVCGPPSEEDDGWSVAIDEYPLFDLPQLTLLPITSTAAGRPVALTLKVVDGTNNPFDLGSLQWAVTPEPGEAVRLTADQRQADGSRLLQAEFVGCTAEPYTVTASGYGRLGAIATRTVSGTASVTAGSCGPLARATIAPLFGAAPLTVELDAGESTVPGGGTPTFHWSADGDREADTAQARFTFDTVGNYRIQLTVGDGSGEVDTLEETVTVANCRYLIRPLRQDSRGLDLETSVNTWDSYTLFWRVCAWTGSRGGEAARSTYWSSTPVEGSPPAQWGSRASAEHLSEVKDGEVLQDLTYYWDDTVAYYGDHSEPVTPVFQWVRPDDAGCHWTSIGSDTECRAEALNSMANRPELDLSRPWCIPYATFDRFGGQGGGRYSDLPMVFPICDEERSAFVDNRFGELCLSYPDEARCGAFERYCGNYPDDETCAAMALQQQQFCDNVQSQTYPAAANLEACADPAARWSWGL